LISQSHFKSSELLQLTEKMMNDNGGWMIDDKMLMTNGKHGQW
jgi:hypothetical protein